MAVAVLLPLSFYFIVNELSKGKVKLPRFYRIAEVDTQRINGEMYSDTQYHKVNELALTNQLGQQVTLNKDLDGKMVVINFFYTGCTANCPKLTASMKQLMVSFKKDAKKETSLENAIQFISISVDPERDSFQAMRTYADKAGANHDHWWFLTGDKHTINNFINNELGIHTGGSIADSMLTNNFVLLDKDRYIRGYYNGLNDTDVRKCADDVVLLTLEKKKKNTIHKGK